MSISGFASVGLTDPFDYSTSGRLNGVKFTSRDRDNDLSSGNCAHYHGGWWHNRCSVVQVNDVDDSIIYINREYHAPELIEIKIRPCDNNKID